MKLKLKEILDDEKKRTLVILVIVVIILMSSILGTFMIFNKTKKESPQITNRVTESSKKKDIFRGFETKEINYDTEIKVNYDLASKHEFIYANGSERVTIYTNYKEQELLYELNLEDGVILFKEQRYNKSLNAYEFTSKVYKFSGEANITDYIVAPSCEQDMYSIIAKDSKGNVYVFNTPTTEFGINDILANFKKIKIISASSKVGYYNYNNYPHKDCNEYDLIYLDTSNNVRYINKNNKLFYDDAYFSYLGSEEYDNFVYVLKTGLMKYESSSNSYLNDGDYNIYYMGSFYTLNENNEDLYIIGTNGYLYKISNFSSSSSQILKPVRTEKVKKIGTRIITNEQGYATDKRTIRFEFMNDEVLEIGEIYAFELLS